MKNQVITLAAVAVVVLYTVTGALATVFTVSLQPTSSTTVTPGGSVGYEMVGVLSGDPSLGLALWGVSLHSSYAIPGGLPQAEPGPEMGSFVKPEGTTNPAGYGGTLAGDDTLVQIGGGQNTIGNTGPATHPIGQVILGIGSSPVVLATGIANLPTVPGDYRLEILDLFANVIISGSGGPPPEVYSVATADAVLDAESFDIVVTPEPATLLVLALGCAAVMRRRR